MVEMSKELRNCLGQVSQDVAADLDRESGRDASIVAEVCCDAKRLAMWGYTSEQDELDALVKEYGWPEVQKEAMKHVATW